MSKRKQKQRIAWLCTQSLVISFWRCVVLHETPKQYRVRFTAKTALPRGWVPAGTVATVPKDAVTFDRPIRKHSLEGLTHCL